MDYLCYLCLEFAMHSLLLIVALWSSAGKGLSYWLLLEMSYCDFFTFPCGIKGTGVVLDCIDS